MFSDDDDFINTVERLLAGGAPVPPPAPFTAGSVFPSAALTPDAAGRAEDSYLQDVQRRLAQLDEAAAQRGALALTVGQPTLTPEQQRISSALAAEGRAVSPDILQADQRRFEAEIELARTLQALRAAPATARWAALVDNAAYVRRDAGTLARMERFFANPTVLQEVAAGPLALLGAAPLVAGGAIEGAALSADSLQRWTVEDWTARTAQQIDRIAALEVMGDAAGGERARRQAARAVRVYGFRIAEARALGQAFELSDMIERGADAAELHAALAEMTTAIMGGLTPAQDTPLGQLGAWVSSRLRETLAPAVGTEENLWTEIGGAVGSLVTFMAISAATRSWGSFPAAGALGVTEAYERARAHGLSHDDALERARFGAIPGAVQALSIEFLMRRLPGVSRRRLGVVVRDVGITIAAELAVETAGAIGQNLLEQTYNPDQSTFENTFAQGLLSGSAAGLLRAIMLASIPGARRSLFRDIIRTERSADIERVFEALRAGATAAEIRETAPERFRDWAASVATGTPAETVHISAEGLQKLAQSLNDPAALEKIVGALPGVTVEALQDAIARGEDLAIPMATWLTDVVGTPMDAALLAHIRLDPTQLTAFERVARAAEIKEEVARLAKRVAAMEAGEDVGALEPEEQARLRVFEQAVERIVDAGVPRAQAESYAAQYAAFFARQAARAGVSIEAFLERFPLAEVQMGDDGRVTVHAEPAPVVDPGTGEPLEFDANATIMDLLRDVRADGARPNSLAAMMRDRLVAKGLNPADMSDDELIDALGLREGLQQAPRVFSPRIDMLRRLRGSTALASPTLATLPLGVAMAAPVTGPNYRVMPTSVRRPEAVRPPAASPDAADGPPARDAQGRLLGVDQLPGLEKASPGRVPGVRELAAQYMRARGAPVRFQAVYGKVDLTRAHAVALAFEEAEHRPDDPEVRAAYEALAAETIAQYEALLALGYTFTWIKGEDPYGSPADAIRDMQDNKHLFVFPTDDGYGQGEITDAERAANPLLRPTDYTVDGRVALVNDLFRIVHDVFGHGTEGASFGARGEENAWQAHVRMFSPLAARAMTTETRGQNSWVNFGPHGRHNRDNPKETIYADQKITLLPEWASTEGQGPDAAMAREWADNTPLTAEELTSGLSVAMLRRPGWAALTAAIEDNPDVTPAMNAERNRLLRARLDAEGIPFIRVQGRYMGGDPQEAYIVLTSEENALRIAADFTQESILTREGLVFPDPKTPTVPSLDIIHEGAAARAQDFYSETDTGFAFSFGLDFTAPRFRPDRPQLPIRPDGLVELHHWAAEAHDSIKPVPVPGGASAAFYGIAPRASRDEPGTGYVTDFPTFPQHIVAVDPQQLYPWFEDPDGLQAALTAQGIEDNPAAYAEAIERAGYQGYYITDDGHGSAPHGNTAALFHAAPVETVIDNNTGLVLKQSSTDDRWYYSALTAAIESLPQESAHAQQWIGVINNLQGVKEVERAWTGIRGWLGAQNGPVSKERLVTYLRSQELDVRTEVAGGNRGVEVAEVHRQTEEVGEDQLEEAIPDYLDDKLDGAIADAARDLSGDVYEAVMEARQEQPSLIPPPVFDVFDANALAHDVLRHRLLGTRLPNSREAEAALNAITAETAADVRNTAHKAAKLEALRNLEQNADEIVTFEVRGADGAVVDTVVAVYYDETYYWGGREYYGFYDLIEAIQEDYLTDGPGVGGVVHSDEAARWAEHVEPGGENYREFRFVIPNLHIIGPNRARDDVDAFVNYNHYETRNIVTTARTTDRTAPDGRKVLALEEVQADLASRWRDELKGQPADLREESVSEDVNLDDTPFTPFPDQLALEVAFKRMLNIAVLEGFDAIAWTPGYMQARRWSGSVQNVVHSIEWETPATTPAEQARAYSAKQVEAMQRELVNALFYHDLYETGEITVPGGEGELDILVNEDGLHASVGRLTPHFDALRLPRFDDSTEGRIDRFVWDRAHADGLTHAERSVRDQLITLFKAAERAGAAGDAVSAPNTDRVVTMKGVRGKDVFIVNTEGVITGKPSGPIREADVVGKTLADVFGGVMGTAVMAEAAGQLTGQQLVVGGEGFTNAYDRHIKNFAAKWAKPFGGKVRLDSTLPGISVIKNRHLNEVVNDLAPLEVEQVYRVMFGEDQLTKARLAYGDREATEARAALAHAREQGNTDRVGAIGPVLAFWEGWAANGFPRAHEHSGYIGVLKNSIKLADLDKHPEVFKQFPVFSGYAPRPVWMLDFNDKMRAAARAKQPLLQTREQKARGQIVLAPEGGAPVISLFAAHDLSTMLHEMGHHYLYILQTMAGDRTPAADPTLRRDWETIKAWWVQHADIVAADATKAGEAPVTAAQVKRYLSRGTTGNAARDNAIRVGLQEIWARGMETYFREGRSPSIALRHAFHKFKAWLRAVYERATQLNAPITPEIREVFDRLFATDEEISLAREVNGFGTLTAADAASMGVDQDTWERLLTLQEEAAAEQEERLLRETMAPLRARRRREYQAARAAHEARIRAEVQAEPVHRLREWLGNRRWLGDGPPDGLPAGMTMDRAELVEAFGEGILRALPRGRYALYSRVGEKGMPLEEVAGWFGFTSADQMIRALQGSPGLEAEVKQRVDAAMDAVTPDPLADMSVEEEAVNALHGEKSGQLLVAELRALSKAQGVKGKVTPRQMAREVARRTIAAMSAREATRSQRWLAAERRAAALAAEALARGDRQAAFDAKKLQLVNHMLYSESLKAAALVEKTERLAKRLQTKAGRAGLASDYLDALDEVLGLFEFRRTTNKELDRRGALRRFVARMEAEGRENELAIPSDVLERAERINYRELTVEHLEGVHDTLTNIAHVGRWKQRMIDARDKRDHDAKVDEVLSAFTENIPVSPRNRVATKQERRRAGIKQYLNLVLSASTLIRKIDGQTALGPAYRNLKQVIDTATRRRTAMLEDLTKKLEALYAPYSRAEMRRMSRKERHDFVDADLSKWDIISIALNMGNVDNLDRLTDTDSRGFTRAQVDRLVGTLDKRDWDFVQGMWDLINSYWGEIAARERRVTGVVPKKIEAVPVETKFGTYRGGYYPIKYDGELSAQVTDEQAADLMSNMLFGRFGKAQTARGHLEARKGSGGRPLALGIELAHSHLTRVVHDLAYSEAVSASWRLLKDSRMRAAFQERGMLDDLNKLELWLQDVATGQVAAQDIMSRVFRRMKSNFTLAKLGFNMSTVLVQLTGIGQSMVAVGSANYAAAYMRYMMAPRSVKAEILKRSQFMRRRQTTFNKDMHDILGDVSRGPVEGTVNWAIRRGLAPAAFLMMQKMQFYAVDIPTWVAAYEQGVQQGMTEADAVVFADDTVVRAQAGGEWADRSAFERGTLNANSRQSDLVRLFTTLGSYMFAKMNVAYERTARAKRVVKAHGVSARSAAEVMKLTSDLALLFMLEAIAYAAIMGRLPSFGDDDEEAGPAAWGAFTARETALTIAAGLPFIRDVTGPLQGFAAGGAYGGLTETFATPLVRAAAAADKGEVNLQLVKSIVNAIGVSTGLPSTATNRIIDGVWREAQGDDVAPVEFLMGRR